MVEESQNIYETMLDKTTKSIEEIIKKLKPVQKFSRCNQKKTKKKIYFIKKKKIFYLKKIFFKTFN